MRQDEVEHLELLFAVSYTDMNGKSDLLPLNEMTMKLNPMTDGYSGYSLPDIVVDQGISAVEKDFSEVLNYPDDESWDSVSGTERIWAQWWNLKNWATTRF